ncbi:MAG: methyltransferase domain-containing protein [Candidatus Poribacteria bacterium]|nr:methyltransferase domain-containing protein [Candidatus Poribacteria bacterium]
MKERYTLGYSSEWTRQLQKRTAAKEAGFFLPYLRSGMRLLDCGCGPGSITVGLAETVAPGQVVGVDIEPSQTKLAQSHAAERRVDNARFVVGNAYRLPFAEGSFDAIFSHNVLSHLRNPLEVLRVMHRMLKSGGVIGISHPDFSGQLISPSDPLLDRSRKLYWRLVEHNGGNPAIGKHQRALLHEAGFVRIEATAKYSTVGTQEAVRMQAETRSSSFAASNVAEQMIALGWTDGAELNQISAAWEAWGEQPGAFIANATVTAVGWKA